MSIASEFDSTIENIKSDYEGLENIGADLTNIDKNIYNIRTCLDNIYSSLPKTTGEGSNLSLTTLKGRINVDDILGDTEQDTTTGKNLLENVFTTETLTSGIQIEIIENKKIKISGTASFVQGTSKFLTTPITLTANTTYTFSVGTKQSGYGIYLQEANGNNLYYIGVSATYSSITFTPTEDVVVAKMSLHFPENNTINTTIYLQLEKGSSATSYEIFTNGASPNPTYPQDINVVTGQQEVVVQNKNILNMPDMAETTISGLTIKVQNNTIYLNGTQTGGSINPYNIIPTDMYLEAGTYTLGSTFSGSTSVVQNFALYLNGTGTTIYYTSSHSKTFTLTERTQITRIAFWTQTNSAYNNVVSKIQLEKGSTKTDFVEHQEQTKTLHLGDIELCKIGTYVDRIYKNNDKWYKHSEIGKNIYTGGSNENWSIWQNIVLIDDTTIKNLGTSNTNLLLNYFQASTNIAFIGSSTGQRLHIQLSNAGLSEITSVSSWKNWLSTHSLYFYYVRNATDTEITNTTLIEELNELEKMMSYNGQTNISVSGNLPMILDVSALKGE